MRWRLAEDSLGFSPLRSFSEATAASRSSRSLSEVRRSGHQFSDGGVDDLVHSILYSWLLTVLDGIEEQVPQRGLGERLSRNIEHGRDGESDPTHASAKDCGNRASW